MKRIVLCAGLALVLFGALVVVGILNEDEPITAAGLAADLFEMAILASAVAAMAYLSAETRDFRRERSALVEDLARAKSEGAHWRAAATVHIEGLSAAIGAQFVDWELSESEAEIAGLLLKGLSHKEVADLRRSSEATVRQQARAIYRKSGLGGRAELSAFFLEDLLAPKSVRRPAANNGSTLRQFVG